MLFHAHGALLLLVATTAWAEPDGGTRAGRGTVEVHVVEPKKAPVIGATVRAFCGRPKPDAGADSPRPFRRIVTDVKGVARLEGMQPCVWSLEVTAEGFLPTRDVRADTTPAGANASVRVEMQPGTEAVDASTFDDDEALALLGQDALPVDFAPRLLDVRVTWGGGPPPPHTRLYDESWSLARFVGEVDEKGRAHLRLHPRPAAFPLTAKTPYGSWATVQLKETDKSIRVDIPKGKLLEGRVEAADGGRVAGTCVVASGRTPGDSAWTEVDERGEFRVNPPGAGPYRLEPGADDFSIDAPGCQTWGSDARVDAGARGVVLRLWAPRALKGHLVDEHGAPVAGVELEAVAPDAHLPQWYSEGLTKEDGAFVFRQVPDVPLRILWQKKILLRAVFAVDAGVTEVTLDARHPGMRQPDAGTMGFVYLHEGDAAAEP